jgi:hypothetical protein
VTAVCTMGSPVNWHRQSFGNATKIEVSVNRCSITSRPTLREENEWSETLTRRKNLQLTAEEVSPIQEPVGL